MSDNQSEKETSFVPISINSTQNSTTGYDLAKLEKNFHSEGYLQNPSMISKMKTRIANKESNFQIYRPKGDLELPKDRETIEKINPNDHKYKLFQQLIQPLQGNSIYSYKTLQLKLEMDLLICEYFDNGDLLNKESL